MTVVINGTTGIDTVQDGVVTDIKLNLTANSAEIKEALNASNGAPIYACRAWVNFNGTGTVAIRASGNVSSISDNGTGDYTVNFTTAMPDANYSCQTTAAHLFDAGNSDVTVSSPKPANGGSNPQTTSSVRVVSSTHTSGLTYVDCILFDVAIFR